MSQTSLTPRYLWLLAAATALLSGPVSADKHGHKEHHSSHRESRHDDDRRSHEDDRDDQREEHFDRDHYFNDHHRTIVREYYVTEYRTGRCPPGLQKKHNGCVPPGQKRWVIGRPLPRDVVYYDLPTTVIREIGAPPPGYRFVRVASDILMLSIGTGMVMDALTDLNIVP